MSQKLPTLNSQSTVGSRVQSVVDGGWSWLPTQTRCRLENTKFAFASISVLLCPTCYISLL